MTELETINQEEKAKIVGNIMLFDCEEIIDATMVADLQEVGLQVFQSQAPDDCFKRIVDEKINIVVGDYNPNKKETVDLLTKIKQKRRSVKRIYICNPDQRREMIHLLLKGTISGYFEKPRGLDNLRDGLLHMLHARQALKNQKLLQLFDTVESLPIFPNTYNEFIQAIENDKSIKEISRIIEKDIAIASQVLRIANSEFHRSGTIGSIERAGIYLGLDTIKNIVLTVSLSSMKQLTPSQKIHLDTIVKHSFQVNRNFKNIYIQQTGNELSDQYASVGITHDIGKIIMMQYLPNRFNQIIKYQEKNPDIGFYRSEIELGYQDSTHAEIGAYFLNLWNFPEASVFTALFHHSIDEFANSYRQLLDVFTIVNDLAR